MKYIYLINKNSNFSNTYIEISFKIIRNNILNHILIIHIFKFKNKFIITHFYSQNPIPIKITYDKSFWNYLFPKIFYF
jgi:hypothetical protein